MKNYLYSILKNIIIFSILIFLLQCSSGLHDGESIFLEDGLSIHYSSFTVDKHPIEENFNLVYIQVDPKKFYIDLLIAKDFNKDYLKVKEFSELSNSLVTINGSLFDKNYQPLGLQIQKGKLIQELKKIDGGVFYIKAGQANIVHTSNFTYDKKITFALQSRPRLVENGKAFTTLKKQHDERSFIGITEDKNIIIGITENSKAYFKDLAHILALPRYKKGLNCIHALNLDGGSSTQLYVNHKKFKKSIPGPLAVPNALAVFKSNKKPSQKD